LARRGHSGRIVSSELGGNERAVEQSRRARLAQQKPPFGGDRIVSGAVTIVSCESAPDSRPRTRRRIFLRPQSLRHHRDSRSSSALSDYPLAGFLAGPLASMGSRNCAYTLRN